jgi:hypothetical protein
LTTEPAGVFASTWRSAGTAEKLGPVVSVTVTVKLPFAEFVPSVAEQLTVVVVIGNVDPDGGEQLTGGDPATASLALAVYVTLFPEPESASTVMFEGRLSVGGVVS